MDPKLPQDKLLVGWMLGAILMSGIYISVTAPRVFLDTSLRDLVAGAAAAATTYRVPDPTGDPVKDLATLQAAVNNPLYKVIDGAKAGSGRQQYTINGMLRLNRDITIKNLDLNQNDTDYVVRTIFATGTTAPLKISLINMKIKRGPEGSEATGSISDSGTIWLSNVIPTIDNIEMYGGGKGRGIFIHKATKGSIVNARIHDITWKPYPVDQANTALWRNFTLAGIQSTGNWNSFVTHDYKGSAGLVPGRIEEQVYGIVLQEVSNFTITNPRIDRLLVQFSDGMKYPYQTDGITVVSGDNITVTGAKISNVAEGFDIPGFPPKNIQITDAAVSDSPLFCYKIRGAYESSRFLMSQKVKSPTLRNTVGTRCGMAAYVMNTGGNAWLFDTKAVDTGVGPGGSAAPQIYKGKPIANISAYRVMQGSALPILEQGSQSMGMRIINAASTVTGTSYLAGIFHSEASAASPATRNVVSEYTVTGSASAQVFTNFATIPETEPSWDDITGLATDRLNCQLNEKNQQTWFMNVIDGIWNYDQLDSQIDKRISSGDFSDCMNPPTVMPRLEVSPKQSVVLPVASSTTKGTVPEVLPQEAI